MIRCWTRSVSNGWALVCCWRVRLMLDLLVMQTSSGSRASATCSTTSPKPTLATLRLSTTTCTLRPRSSLHLSSIALFLLFAVHDTLSHRPHSLPSLLRFLVPGWTCWLEGWGGRAATRPAVLCELWRHGWWGPGLKWESCSIVVCSERADDGGYERRAGWPITCSVLLDYPSFKNN